MNETNSSETPTIDVKTTDNSPSPALSDRERMLQAFRKTKEMGALQRINFLRANNVLNDKEARSFKAAVPLAPPAPAKLQEGQQAMRWLDMFVTTDPQLLQVKEHVKLLAPHRHPVLILGDSGTGKELIARSLHGNRFGKFIAINCAAISENLIESELFGHMKGSFTGAFNDRAGLLIAAQDGTAFLDEIGDLPYGLQAKLLRAIQNKVIRRVGSNEDEPISCRIVAATHKDIVNELDVSFRLDLYYRLSTFKLELKPLKERPYEDFVALARHFGGDETDADRLFPMRASLRGNIRDIEQYFLRKQVLGIVPE